MFRKLGIVCGLLSVAGGLYAETGYEAWLRYAPLDAGAVRQYREALPPAIVTLGSGTMVSNAGEELIRGVRSMTGFTLRVAAGTPGESAILVGTLAEIRKAAPRLAPAGTIGPEGYWLRSSADNGVRYLLVTGEDERGVLYGAFALLRKISLRESVAELDDKQAPSAAIRWLNLWDSVGGPRPQTTSTTQTTGQSLIGPPVVGGSVLFDQGKVREDLSRVNDYARMLASVGINGCAIANVNADRRFFSAEFAPQLQRLAAVFRAWGVRIVLPVEFSSPKTLGGLDTFDPQDAGVANWWKARADDLYRAVPDLAGFVMKADSEGQTGPSTYDRTIADAANTLAARPQAAWRPAVVPRVCLRPSPGLAQPEERPRAGGLRQFPPARRPVRRQRGGADQERPDRFPGARAGVAALCRPRKDQPDDGGADLPGVQRAGAAPHVRGAAGGRTTSISTCASVGATLP